MKENISEKEQFFSKISHDLRGSFTSILGFSDILNDPSESFTMDEVYEYSKRIQVQSKDTFTLLVNFINWLKLENFRFGLSAESVELYDALLETKNNHKKILVEKNIEVEFKVEENETVLIDYEILTSILNNLFTFLIEVSGNNANILVREIKGDLDKAKLEISAFCDDKNSSYLQQTNLMDLNNEHVIPLIFARKFTELSGGTFNFSIDEKNNLTVTLQLPKEQKN